MPKATVAQVLADFSQCLLRLHALARQAPVDRFLAEALSQFARLVPFDAAWWGQASRASAGAPPVNWQYGSLGLAPRFGAEWNRIGGGDAFALRSMDSLGGVCRASGFEDENPAVEAFSRRHGLLHVMALTVELEDSGLLFFVSLYRRPRGRAAFSEAEAELFGHYVQHLKQHWAVRMQDTLRLAVAEDGRSTALAETGGRLLHVGERVAALLARTWPGWDGQQLPEAFMAQARRAPCQVRLGRRSVAVRPVGGLLAISAGAPQPQQPLAPREREAALLYAGGEAYKEIARRLGLSPATVRTYLRDVYARLGVRNKQELARVLGLSAGR